MRLLTDSSSGPLAINSYSSLTNRLIQYFSKITIVGNKKEIVTLSEEKYKVFLACGMGAEGFSGDRVAGHTAGGGDKRGEGFDGVNGFNGRYGRYGRFGLTPLNSLFTNH